MALPCVVKGSTLTRQSSFGAFHGALQVRNLGVFLRREVPGGESAQDGAKAIEQLGERPAGVAIETQSIARCPQRFGLTDPDLPLVGMNTMARVGYILRFLSMTRMQLFLVPGPPQVKDNGIAMSVPADFGALLNQ